jgi:hypothetical protein
MNANRHDLLHNSTKRRTRLTKRSTISIKMTVYTEDKAVDMAVDHTTSVKKVYCFLLDFTGFFFCAKEKFASIGI